ncbi:MAG TPA: hypothetical protein VNE16_06915 [Vicinamibacterales bacterium]|nr:hypothetical protein [Vicinamibacterales bacterium]
MGGVISHLVAWWATVYANHSNLETCVEFAHVGGLLAGGGCAVAADRATLRASRESADVRALRLNDLAGVHRIVIISLGFVIASGVLLFASDVGTFLHSYLFWTKMGLVAVLLANGGILARAERRAAGGEARAWRRLQYASVASLTLWFTTALIGTALLNL